MIPVRCPHCRDAFEAADALAGGLTNCPRCGKAVPVEGLRDPLWRLLQAGAFFVAVAAGVLVGRHDEWLGLAVAAALLAAAWLLGRAL